MGIKIHLQPKQDILYGLIRATGPEAKTIIGGGGGKGCGKSKGARSIAVRVALELGEQFPGITITITRRVEGDLIDNHITPMFLDWPELREYWQAGEKRLAIPGRGVINFRYAQTKDDVIRKFMGGYESAINIVEEAQQFTEEELLMIHASSRWTDRESEVPIPENLCKTVLLFNTGGLAASYLRRVFHLKQYKLREDPEQYKFVLWYGWDNYEWFRAWGDAHGLGERDFYRLPSMCSLGSDSLGHGLCCRFHLFVRETTEGRKYNAYPAAIRQGYLLADFDHFEGQYFAGVWDERKCTIPAHVADRVIQPWWRRWMGFDWGFGHHSANYWCAAGNLSPKELYEAFGIMRAQTTDVLVVYRELVVNRTPEFELATRIVDMTPPVERREIKRWFVGWDVFSKDRHATNTVAELMEPVAKDAGMPEMERAVIDRVPGWRTLHDCFRRTCALRSEHPPDDIGDGPVLLISSNCPALISAIPVLVADPKRLEDVLKLETIEDDVADGFRYAIESFLQAKTQAPVDVRAREAYNSVDDMTAKALRMRVFAEAEKHKAAPQRRFRRG